MVVFVHLGPLSTEILRYDAPAWSLMSAHVPRTWPRDHRPRTKHGGTHRAPMTYESAKLRKSSGLQPSVQDVRDNLQQWVQKDRHVTINKPPEQQQGRLETGCASPMAHSVLLYAPGCSRAPIPNFGR